MNDKNPREKLVLIGGGGHCKSVIDTILCCGHFSDIVILDPALASGDVVMGCKVAGTDDELPKLFRDGYKSAFITVGSIVTCELRKRLVKKCEKIGFSFPIIIDPSAKVSKTAVLAKGTFVGKNAVINADSYVGEHCIVNTGAIIEHECLIGSFVHISVGSILCGNVTIGCESFIGAGSTIIQGIKIENGVIVGANSTILADVEGNMNVYGIVTKVERGGYSIKLYLQHTRFSFGCMKINGKGEWRCAV